MNKFITSIIGFDWDKWNKEKNFIRHNVRTDECEEIFFSMSIIEEIPIDEELQEKRYYAFGITKEQRKLIIVFTIRNNKIRVISARDMSKKERIQYEERIKKGSQI